MSRKRIREIDNRYYCSIIGTCLSFDEVRALLEDSYSEDFSDCSDYILHGMAVNGAEGVSRFSNRLGEKLNSKYMIDVHRSNSIDNCIDLQMFWESSYSEGNISGAYWALLSHSECTEEIRNQAFGEVHMLSHLAGEGQRTARTEIRGLKSGINILKSKYAALKTKNLYLSDENKSLRRENGNLSERVARHADETCSNFDEIAGGDSVDAAEKLQRKLRMAKQRNNYLEVRLSKAGEELEDLREYNELLNKLLKSAGDAAESSCDSCDSCIVENCLNLKGRRVLLVGGRLSMVPYCKEVVESMDGEFLHHDGGKELSRLALRSLAVSADIIICALDCVSHDATRCVKKICSGGPQKIIMLKNSGLSTFTRELRKAV